jgi:hypothetical protein
MPGRVPEPPPLPFRLRTVLVLLLLGGAIWFCHPRAMAAYKLHTSATTVADYALCMVGPTGPALLRDHPPEFQRLVRRRVVSAAPNDRPFQQCAKAAREITGSPEIERAHLATAWSFVEHGGAAADRARASRKRELSVGDLQVTARPLAELSKRAWPFSREGYVSLMKPSLRAPEAIHPIELARPKSGSGLPAWRSHYQSVVHQGKDTFVALGRGANLAVFHSSDGGINWRSASPRDAHVAEVSERCPTGQSGRSFVFSLSDDGRTTLVTSLGPDAAPENHAVAPADREVFAAACDERALTAAIKTESSREVSLYLCPYRARCTPMALPRFAGVGALPRFPLDIARIAGTTILAVTAHGVVRVSSTRDDGKTWTPFTVAFDEAEHPETAKLDVRTPSRLLAVGERLFLYGGATKAKQTYSVIVSDDSGASWRAP